MLYLFLPACCPSQTKPRKCEERESRETYNPVDPVQVLDGDNNHGRKSRPSTNNGRPPTQAYAALCPAATFFLRCYLYQFPPMALRPQSIRTWRYPLCLTRCRSDTLLYTCNGRAALAVVSTWIYTFRTADGVPLDTQPQLPSRSDRVISHSPFQHLHHLER